MKKKFLFLFFNCASCIVHCAFSQPGMWTWISGSNIMNATGVYGTQGIPSVNNHPPAEYESIEWKDKQGNFWIYGGTYPDMNDLWKFNPTTLEWTWMKGNGLPAQLAVYGTQGVPDPLNTPGTRTFSAVSWVDTSGNFWLFGGQQFGDKNDLWKYDVGTNEWTWMHGSTGINVIGSHGVQGIPSATNEPGARAEVSTGWTDSSNNLWLFGGSGIGDNGMTGYLNDLMKYSIATNEWTWMKGSRNPSAIPAWGQKNVPDPANDPGARFSHTHWTDADGLWLMGGLTNDFYNDVWRFDLSTNEWTWKAGTNIANTIGVYNNTCVFDSINQPFSRTEHRSGVQDPCGRYWMFGGINWNIIFTSLSDLWIFDPVSLNWSWVYGTSLPNQTGNYGTLGIPAATNAPPCRSGANAWWGNDNRFYVFGGLQDNSFVSPLGDMWVYAPDSLCAASCVLLPVAQFSSDDSICPGTCISLNNLSLNATSYSWAFPGANPDTSTSSDPQNICYNFPGTYDIELIAFNATGSDTLLISNYVTVYPSPLPQSITQHGDSLIALPGANAYQWYYNGNVISGATDFIYLASASGDYNVVATDANGCEVEAAIFDVMASAENMHFSEGLAIFPNPVEERLSVTGYSSNGSRQKISIFNGIGEKVYEYFDQEIPEIDCRHFANGMYVLEIISDVKIFRVKFIKQ